MTSACATPRRPFLRRRHRLATLMIFVIALCHGGVSFANIISASHLPTTWQHAFDGEPDSAEHHAHEHLHSHDSGLDDDDGEPDRHGHDASDHSHDKSNVPSDGGLTAAGPTARWSVPLFASAYPAPPFDFERPPKLSSAH